MKAHLWRPRNQSPKVSSQEIQGEEFEPSEAEAVRLLGSKDDGVAVWVPKAPTDGSADDCLPGDVQCLDRDVEAMRIVVIVDKEKFGLPIVSIFEF
jgi:hypothetical protein